MSLTLGLFPDSSLDPLATLLTVWTNVRPVQMLIAASIESSASDTRNNFA